MAAACGSTGILIHSPLSRHSFHCRSVVIACLFDARLESFDSRAPPLSVDRQICTMLPQNCICVNQCPRRAIAHSHMRGYCMQLWGMRRLTCRTQLNRQFSICARPALALEGCVRHAADLSCSWLEYVHFRCRVLQTRRPCNLAAVLAQHTFNQNFKNRHGSPVHVNGCIAPVHA